MLKKFKKTKYFSIICSVLFVMLTAGLTYAAAQVINNYYGNTTVNQSASDGALGAVTATGGICTGSEPATTMCNLSVYDLSSQTAINSATTLTAGTDLTVNGNVTLGNATSDIITPTGYFTYARIGTGSTFGHISTVGADELGVEGNVEIDGTTYLDGETFVERFTQGGTVLASSTTAAVGVLTAAQITTYSQIDYTPGNLAVSLTLPATSTMTALIPNTGDMITFRIRNLDSVAATSTTIVAGAGIDLIENENGDVVIEGGNEAFLRFRRESDTDVTVSVDEYIAAD